MSIVPPGADDSSSTTAEMLSIVRDYWFLGVLSGGVAFFVGLQRIKNGYKHRNSKELIGNLLLSSVVLAVLAIGTALLSPLVLGDAVSPKIELGIGIAVGGFGLKFFDFFMMARFGMKIIAPSNQDDLNGLKECRPPETLSNHCPVFTSCGCNRIECVHCQPDTCTPENMDAK